MHAPYSFSAAVGSDFHFSMNRPPHPALSPSEGERVPEGRVRGRFMVPLHARSQRLSMNPMRRSHRPTIVLWFGLVLPILPAQALEATWEYAVRVNASVQTSPPQIALNWPQDTIATPSSYTVYRKAPEANSWGAGTTVPGTATGFVD